MLLILQTIFRLGLVYPDFLPCMSTGIRGLLRASMLEHIFLAYDMVELRKYD